MEKIKTFLHPKAEFIWWGLIIYATINGYMSSTKILALHYLLVGGIIPYLIGKKLHKDRWFYSYYIGSALSLASYQTLITYLYHPQPIIPFLIKVIIPNLLGTSVGFFYFQTHKNSKYNKLITFVIFAVATMISMILFGNI